MYDIVYIVYFQAKRMRNYILHTGTSELDDTVLHQMINHFIVVLEEPNVIQTDEAKQAILNLQDVI